MRIALLVIPILLAACAASPAPEPQAVPGAVPGGIANMANPASVYCGKVGGTLEIRHEADGDAGYCHLPDGRVVEEWTLFRADNPG